MYKGIIAQMKKGLSVTLRYVTQYGTFFVTNGNEFDFQGYKQIYFANFTLFLIVF